MATFGTAVPLYSEHQDTPACVSVCVCVYAVILKNESSMQCNSLLQAVLVMLARRYAIFPLKTRAKIIKDPCLVWLHSSRSCKI